MNLPDPIDVWTVIWFIIALLLIFLVWPTGERKVKTEEVISTYTDMTPEEMKKFMEENG